MIIEAIVLSLIVGIIRRGKFSNLQYIPFRGAWLFLLSYAVQAFALLWLKGPAFYWVHLLSYLILLFGIMANYKLPPVFPIYVGTLLNGIVIAVNNGQMPVKLPMGIGAANFDQGHALITSSTKLWFLADIIIVDRPYPWPKVLSIGDLFLIAGIFWFIQYWLTYHKKNNILNTP